MSPEQGLGQELDIRTDLYSLGATLYYLLSGAAPFEGSSLPQKLIAHQFKEPKPIAEHRSDVPEELNAVMLRLMAKEREARYATPAELIAALKPWTPEHRAPPDAKEMPRMSPAAYRLGLISGPGGRPVKRDSAASWDFPLEPTTGELRGDTPHGSIDETHPRPRPPVIEPTQPLPASRNEPLLTRRSALLGGAAVAIERGVDEQGGGGLAREVAGR
jgi:serine/threonine protein kinase